MRYRKLVLNLLQSHPCTEESILQKIKEKLKKNSIEKAKRAENLSPLGLAASLGFVKILRYLIEEKGCDPNEVTRDDMTALDIAILSNKTDAALYLIGKTDRYILSKEDYGYKSLYLALQDDAVDIVKALFEHKPELSATLNNKNNTPLHQAVLFGASKSFKYLLELENQKSTSSLEMDVNKTNFEGFTPLNYVFMSANPACLNVLLNSPFVPVNPLSYHGRHFSHFEIIMDIDPTKVDIKTKLQCVYLLLAAGAGLNSQTIPEIILERLNLKRSRLGPFLLLGYDKLGKRRLIDNVQNFRGLINNPDWHFELRQIALFCQNLNFSHLPHAHEILSLLPSKFKNETAQSFGQKAIPQQLPRILPLSEITRFDPDNLMIYVDHQRNRLINLRSLLNDSLENVFNAVRSNDFNVNVFDRLKETAKLYYESFSHVCHFLDLEKIIKSKREDLDFFEILAGYTRAECKTFLHFSEGCNINSALVDNYFILFNKLLKRTIKNMGQIISVHYPVLFFELINAKALCVHIVTRFYEKAGEADLVFSLAHQELQSIKKIRKRYHLPQASALDISTVFFNFTLGSVYLEQGYLKEALKHVNNAVLYFQWCYFDDIFMVNTLKKIVSFLEERSEYRLAYQLLSRLIDVLNKEVSENTEKNINENFEFFYEKLQSIANSLYCKTLSQTIPLLCEFSEVDDSGEMLTCTLFRDKFHAENRPCFKEFLNNYSSVKSLDAFKLNFSKEFILKNNFENVVSYLAKIMFMEVKHQSNDLATTNTETSFAAQFAALSLKGKKNKKRSGVGCSSYVQEDSEKEAPLPENAGFTVPTGYSQVVPIFGNVPKNSLFISIKKEEKFTPFFKLIFDQKKNEYHSVRCIASKGRNQQGVKLSTIRISDGGETKKISIARLKVYGDSKKFRARGSVFQQYRTADNQLRKLYLIDDVCPKKEEMRKKLV